MSTQNPGLKLLEKRVDELGLRREVEDDLARILIEHKIANLRKRRGLTGYRGGRCRERQP